MARHWRRSSESSSPLGFAAGSGSEAASRRSLLSPPKRRGSARRRVVDKMGPGQNRASAQPAYETVGPWCRTLGFVPAKPTDRLVSFITCNIEVTNCPGWALPGGTTRGSATRVRPQRVRQRAPVSFRLPTACPREGAAYRPQRRGSKRSDRTHGADIAVLPTAGC